MYTHIIPSSTYALNTKMQIICAYIRMKYRREKHIVGCLIKIFSYNKCMYIHRVIVLKSLANIFILYVYICESTASGITMLFEEYNIIFQLFFRNSKRWSIQIWKYCSIQLYTLYNSYYICIQKYVWPISYFNEEMS